MVKNKVENLDFKQGLKDGLPIGISYFPFALAVSIAMTQSGIGFWITQLIFATTYSGVGQSSFLNLYNAGEVSILAYVIMLFVISFRYVIFGISTAQKLHPEMKLWQKVLYGIFSADETYVVMMQKKGKLKGPYLLGLILIPVVGFMSGGICGALFTNFLPASIKSALGIVIFGMFVGMIIPAAKKSLPVSMVVLSAAAISYILECIPPIKAALQLKSVHVVMICAIISACIGALMFPVKDERPEDKIIEEKEES